MPILCYVLFKNVNPMLCRLDYLAMNDGPKLLYSLICLLNYMTSRHCILQSSLLCGMLERERERERERGCGSPFIKCVNFSISSQKIPYPRRNVSQIRRIGSVWFWIKSEIIQLLFYVYFVWSQVGITFGFVKYVVWKKSTEFKLVPTQKLIYIYIYIKPSILSMVGCWF